ncbi:MAG TPA: YafY family transcriptional regulator [Candidatus Pelethocola excrementipullorum]|nr:YafY family transcriptional regulator [Candidatus Pelethocola excrementipullorum]
MQISRLFKIVYLLQETKHLTAKNLAEHFEVSTRTILRDVDTLSEAGIPIYTTKGKGGGIFLLDHFVLNKTTISKKEQDQILFALQSLSLTEQLEEKELLSKLQAFFQNTKTGWIEVDFSRWGSEKSEKEGFGLIKEAILQHKVLSFLYTSSYGETLRRTVNPLRLVFKNHAWYLQAYCRLKEDYRTFKINRAFHMNMEDECFEAEDFEVPPIDIQSCDHFETLPFTLEFSRESAHRAYDNFNASQITRKEDGSVTVKADMVYEPGIYDYFLSLGRGVKIISPSFAKEKLLQCIEEIKANYIL